MPKISDRERLLSELDGVLSSLALFGEEKSIFLKEIFNIYTGLRSSRCLNPNESIAKSGSMLDLVWQYSDKDFKIIARMSKVSFMSILCMIKDDPVFYNQSNHS